MAGQFVARYKIGICLTVQLFFSTGRPFCYKVPLGKKLGTIGGLGNNYFKTIKASLSIRKIDSYNLPTVIIYHNTQYSIIISKTK